jgi:hypothetical protein
MGSPVMCSTTRQMQSAHVQRITKMVALCVDRTSLTVRALCRRHCVSYSSPLSPFSVNFQHTLETPTDKNKFAIGFVY